MTLIAQLKTYANEQHWTFVYGRIDYANVLVEPTPNQIYLVLMVQDTTDFIGQYGVEYQSAKTRMLLLRGADLNVENYESKYEDNIKELQNLGKKFKEDMLDCHDWRPTAWQSVEVINKMDANSDGIMINATFKTV